MRSTPNFLGARALLERLRNLWVSSPERCFARVGNSTSSGGPSCSLRLTWWRVPYRISKNIRIWFVFRTAYRNPSWHQTSLTPFNRSGFSVFISVFRFTCPSSANPSRLHPLVSEKIFSNPCKISISDDCGCHMKYDVMVCYLRNNISPRLLYNIQCRS